MFPNSPQYSYTVKSISRTLLDNKFVGLSDIVGAPPAGAAPVPASFST